MHEDMLNDGWTETRFTSWVRLVVLASARSGEVRDA